MAKEINQINGMELQFLKETNSFGIKKYEGISTKIVIPNDYKEKDITSISKKAFTSIHELKTILFDENTKITSIGKKAFRNCHNLVNISIPEGITEIAKKTFLDCESLVNLSLPLSLVKICKKAFLNCSSLQRLTLPDNLEIIESKAFKNCHSLFEITIPKSVKSIAKDAFHNCRKLVHITNLSNVAITPPTNECEVRTSLDVEFKNKISIDENDFVIYEVNGNKSILAFVGKALVLDLTGYENIPFYPYAFNHCSNITKAILPNTISEINDGLFWQCGNLMTVDMPFNIKKIGKEAFMGCRNLTKFGFSSALTEIGESAFEGCDNLKTIYIENGKLPTKIGKHNEKITLSRTELDLDSNRIIKQIDDRINYSKKEYYREYTDYSGRMAIRQKLDFDKAVSLFNAEAQGLVLKNNTKELKETGVGIETDTYKNGVVVEKTYDENGNIIMEVRTYNKKGIDKVFDVKDCILEERHDYSTIVVRKISDNEGILYEMANENEYVVSGYISKNETMVIPSTFNGKPVTGIKDYAFFSNDYIKNITIPESITKIGKYSFNSCFGLETINLPSKVDTISYGSFFNCKNLKTVSFDGTIKKIEPFAFANCPSLTKPVFDASCEIATTAF
ncbi:MAG: leucine-rich repeat domain-containing protein [Clostridia bacterium]|nr:leucine-rich repeat domain-containing protein [Clostridia bacterium]